MGFNLNDIQLRNELHEKGLRKCPKCGEIKPYAQYGKSKKNGYAHYCKPCKSIIDKEYRDDPIRRQDLLDKKSRYYHKVKNDDWYKDYYKNKVRDYKKETAALKSKPHRVLKSRLRKMTCHAFNRGNNPGWVKKNNKTEVLLGADFFTVKEFLERQFLKGMTWDNYGEVWNIDHIIPLDIAGEDVELINKLCYYQNLSPIYCKDNFRKGFKVPSICTLWENPFVPYKVKDIVIVPRYDGIVVEKYKLIINPGERYGNLTVIEEVEARIVKTSGSRKRVMRCKCDCGNEKDIRLSSLRQGNTVSCGCQQKKSVSEYFKNNPKRIFTEDEVNELKLLIDDIPKHCPLPKYIVDKFEGRTYEQIKRIVREVRNDKLKTKSV
jgi:hypothetical protein